MSEENKNVETAPETSNNDGNNAEVQSTVSAVKDEVKTTENLTTVTKEKPVEEKAPATITSNTDTKPPENDVSMNQTTESIMSESGNVGDNEEEESEESEEELPPGLLEKPVEVEGKRERKKTTRFNYDSSTPSNDGKKEVKVPDGIGKPLSQHPRVIQQLSKNKITDLRLVHKLLFGVLGEKRAIKQNILKFKGFTFAKDSSEYEKKEEEVGRFTVANLKWVMEVCDACKNFSACKSKDDLCDTFMEWLMNPQPQEKPASTPKSKTAVKRKKKTADEKNVEEVSTDGVTPNKAPNKKPRKKKPKTENQASEKSTLSSDEEETEDSNQTPSNAEIKKFITKILKGADLEKLTMKSVFLQVYQNYPSTDLTDRKPFIKETVKKLIS